MIVYLKMWTATAALPLFLFYYVSGDVNCYFCRSVEYSPMDECIANVNASTAVNCTTDYCLVRRRVWASNESRVTDFIRDCSEESRNGIFESNGIKDCIQTCSTDFCNNGTGCDASSRKKEVLSTAVICLALALNMIL